MSGFLLDTNVLSELTRPRPDTQVAQWLDSVDESQLYLSVLTLGEVRKGLTVQTSGRRRSVLESWLGNALAVRFAGRILPIDGPIADRWGRLAGEAQARGTPMSIIDGLLAATALQYDLTVVSRNIRDFALPGLVSFNPWDDATA
jgi:predicted nucleic acid-binding protein